MNQQSGHARADGNDPQSLAQIAERHVRNGRLDLAEVKNREAIALDPQHYAAHNNLGNILRHTGRLSEALRHFARAFEINPTDAVVAHNLAMVLAEQFRFSEAVPFHRHAVDLNPSSVDAQSALAFSLSQLAEHEAAERHYNEALKIDPLHFHARINLGLALADQGRAAQALEQAEVLACAQTMIGFPHKAFGILLARAGRSEAARSCFERHLSCHPGDADEIAMLLATVGGALPGRATDRQISELYALQADRWDKAAAATGGYQGHRLIAAALPQLNALQADTVIDVGCGTGLVGALLRPHVRHLIGVDMSEPMLAQARQKNVYDSLHCADLMAYLTAHPDSCDVVTSAATLIHFGRLDAVFEAVARCLRPRGLFVFTVFPNDDDPCAVAAGTLNGQAQGGCFRHGADYIAGAAATCGLTVELLSREVHEFARKAAVPGLVVALRKAG
ncbi:MAG TPA: tetratricopeptide repeat protein [Bradyrhizobium sp.]|uniref:tetratricopeptide repeat protein n=1 Tax=Bradyrhizobium sp. TaxID=376 RepID=UPI002B642BAE|nr:tetratricopeptide repeat protein [Bradyrhizobium sp.]HLZ04612.1 tetratricopeptide repeat protein [Bradyrhizobium sp.]